MCCEWLPERQRWRCLARSGLLAVSGKKIVLFSHKINPLSTKLVQSRWLDIASFFFFFSFVLFCDSVSVHEHVHDLVRYPAILNSHLVNNPYILPSLLRIKECNTSTTYESNGLLVIDDVKGLGSWPKIDSSFANHDLAVWSQRKPSVILLIYKAVWIASQFLIEIT